jgi:dihydroorotase
MSLIIDGVDYGSAWCSSRSAISRLQAFTSEIGADFYGLPRNEGMARLTRAPWVVPASIGDVVPFRAGEELAWRFDGTSEGDLS